MNGQGGKGRQKPGKAFVVVSHMKGVTQGLQRTYEKHNTQLFCKAGYTI